MRIRLPLLFLILGLLINATQVFAHGIPSESDESSTTGYHIIHLNVGWNLISFPSLNPEVRAGDILLNFLTRGDSVEEADVMYGIDHENGGWKIVWRQTNGQWNGDLRFDYLSSDEAFWVLIREGHDEVDLPIVGPPDTSPNIVRGLYEAGNHLIGTMWPVPQSLSNAGLTDAGFMGFGGLHDSNGNLSDLVIGYDSEMGFYSVAWHDGDAWRGSNYKLEVGMGYLLYVNHDILWDIYPMPQNPDVPEPENAANIPIHHPIRFNPDNQTIEYPPMPYNLILDEQEKMKINLEGVE
jgi:hypothetical protein